MSCFIRVIDFPAVTLFFKRSQLFQKKPIFFQKNLFMLEMLRKESLNFI